MGMAHDFIRNMVARSSYCAESRYRGRGGQVFYWRSSLTATILFFLQNGQGLNLLSYSTTIRSPKILDEATWRTAAREHRNAVLTLLQPGFVKSTNRDHKTHDEQLVLDRQNPIYNFIADYYGFKGSKGVKRLLRWSPGPNTTMLNGVQESDLAETLPLRGMVTYEASSSSATNGGTATYDPKALQNVAAIPFIRCQQVLRQTLSAEPILFCYGLHEWAMQYSTGTDSSDNDDDDDDDTPDDGVVHHYQPHLPRRVSPSVIRKTVERQGVHCTHTQAMQYFTPDALKLNVYPKFQRTNQLQWEQPACVHAQMDLLQYACRLQPFCDADLFREILSIVLEARKLDVAASPYDASSYGLAPVPVETAEGRSLYRKRQAELMEQAQPLRQLLLDQYDCFIEAAFSPLEIEAALQQVQQS